MAEAAQTPTLAELAASQGGVVTRAQLRTALGPAAMRRSVRAKEWQLVRRGVYAERALVGASCTDPVLEHRLACAARMLLSDRDLVASHGSAAVLHQMRLLDDYSGEPQLTLARPPGTPPAHVSGLLAAGLPRPHRTVHSGVPVTTRARTVADLARTLERPSGVVMADAALRSGVDRQAVLAVLGTCTRWPGVETALAIVAFADRRAESALESLARLWFADAGLPAPQLQIRLCHASNGRFVARPDFFWPEHRTVCEVDGRLKYQRDEDADISKRSARPEGDRPNDVLWHEKLREDTLRDLGLEVARGYWSDRHDDGRELVGRIRRAFARGAQRTDAPAYGVLTSGW